MVAARAKVPLLNGEFFFIAVTDAGSRRDRRLIGATVRRVQRRELPAPEVTIGGVRERASTQFGYAGAYSVTLSTALPTLALELHSVYLGHEHTPTLAGHLVLAPRRRRVRHVLHAPGALPVAGAPAGQPGARGRAALLLDHLSELRALLAELTGAADIRVNVDDAALRRLELD